MPIYTVGYGNLTFEQFIEKLRPFSISHLVDVRAIPYSKYQLDFGRERLALLLPPTGLKYVYMGDRLGGAKGTAEGLEGERLVEFLQGRPGYESAIQKFVNAAESKAICLMCGCSKPEVCHRSWLLGESLQKAGVETRHILSDGTTLGQPDLMRLRLPDQQELFQ